MRILSTLSLAVITAEKEPPRIIQSGHLCLEKYTENQDCTVDYGDLGSFSTAEPWSYVRAESENPLDVIGHRPAVVPATPKSIGTFFSFLNKELQFTEAVDFDLSNVSKMLTDTPYYKGARTLIYAHGWTSTSGSIESDPDSNEEPRSLFYRAFKNSDEPTNIIMVDWRKGAASPKYWVPATNTRVVGSQVERLIHHLVENGFNKPEDFHLSGHSLGAHVMGYAGKFYQERHNGAKLERITGCDPAGPMFQHTDDEMIRRIRLDRDDAKFVDVIHTNAGDLDVVHLLDIVNRTGVVDEALQMLECSRDCFKLFPNRPRPRRAIVVERQERLNEECLLQCAAEFGETVDEARGTVFKEDPIQVGIHKSIGHADFWPNGGTHHNGECNEENYFWNLGCDHGFSYKLLAATMRQECQSAQKCQSYENFESGYCQNNPSMNPGWAINSSQVNLEDNQPQNFFWDTEYESGDFCAIQAESEPDSTAVKTLSVLLASLFFL